MQVEVKTATDSYFKEFDEPKEADLTIQKWLKDGFIVWDDGKTMAVFPISSVTIFLHNETKKSRKK